MALKTAPRRSLLEIVRYITLLAFRPSKFERIATIENAKLEAATKDERTSTAHIRTALGGSFAFVALATLVGSIIGWLVAKKFGAPGAWLTILQTIGAFLVLWATLAVKGWEIQSFAGTTLEEQVNRWIYRSLYTVGTALFICSLVWGWLTGPAT